MHIDLNIHILRWTNEKIQYKNENDTKFKIHKINWTNVGTDQGIV